MSGHKRTCPTCGRAAEPGAKFCLKCGTALPGEEKQIVCPVCGRKTAAGDRFCIGCGTRLDETKPQKAEQNPVCPECGTPADADSKFCLKCGAKLDPAASKRKRNSKAPSMPKPSLIPEIPSGLRLSALSSAGEMDLGELGGTISSAAGEIASVSKDIHEVLSPFAGIAHTVFSYLGGIFGMFVRPKVLFYALFMAGIWTLLSVFKDSDSEILKILSWLTCAEGGIAGKGCTAFMLSTLFSGGIPNTFKGIGSLFRKDGKGSIAGSVFGLIAGAFCSLLMISTGSSSMAGISGALLSLQAAGRKDGNLYRLAESLTSAKNNGVRIAHHGKAKSMLVGLTLGFAIITAIMALAD